jgi:hypothetical protein
MGNRNRYSIAASMAVGTLLALIPAAAAAQTPARPPAQTPAQTAAQPYRAPRTKDGKPNLNGIWQAVNSANWDIEGHGAAPGPFWQLGAEFSVPPGLGVVEGGSLPYKPEALKQKQENFADRMNRDPEIKCYLPGVPRAMYMPYPFQIIQSPEQIMMVFEFAGALRTVYMKHSDAPADSWMGWSNGKWDGESLVIDTSDFIEKSWFDRSGNFHSDELKVTERLTPIDKDHLNYEVTITDPKVFTRAWKMSMPLYRMVEKNAQVLEYKCVEFSEDVIYGQLYKVPLKK